MEQQAWRPRHLNLLTLALLTVSALAAGAVIEWRDVGGVVQDAGIPASFSAMIFAV